MYFTKSSRQGVQTQTYLVASKSVSTAAAGTYYDNSAPAATSAAADDVAAMDGLWQLSEQLTGVTYKFG